MENVKNIPKIDIHAHATAFPDFFPPCRWNERFISAEEVLDFYEKLGIEKGVMLPLASPEGQITAMTTEACKMIVDKYPDRFILFCNVDPRSISIDQSLLFYKEKLGAKGFGELTSNVYADDPYLDKVFACCAELDLPVTIHINKFIAAGGYGIVDELGLPRLEKVLKKHPKLKILGHSQCFWSEISADNTEEMRMDFPKGKVKDGRIAQLMREYEGLYCDLSANSGSNALMRDPEYAARFIEEFSDRILYGCDLCAPSNTMPFPFKEFLEKMLDDGMISPENYRKIVRDNAIKLLNL